MLRFAVPRRLVVLAAILAVFGVVAAGCTPAGSTSNSVSAKVLYKNSPVTGGGVVLHHASGQFPSSINLEGKFNLSNIPEGDVVMTIETESVKDSGLIVPPDMTPGMKDQFEKARATLPPSSTGTYVPIPKKYADPSTSDLKFTIKKGKNELGDITLKD